QTEIKRLLERDAEMNGYSSFLVPTRFLVLLAHLVLCFCSVLNDGRKSQNYGVSYSQLADEYYEYVISYSLSVIFLILELCGFLSGATMFTSIQSIISISCHFSGTILTAHFIIKKWAITSYWYGFAFTICLPLLLECWNVMSKVWFRNSL
ncbi:unnamed protein product, partial [Heterobilharzia americana]